jgi:hypothetical protein
MTRRAIRHGPAQYCQTRRALEELGWFMTDRLCNLSRRLVIITGNNHSEFLEVKCECEQVRREISVARVRLANHRREHGC